jgi:lambda family phage portal protein
MGIGTLIDRAVATVSPERGLRRQYARQLQQDMLRAHDASEVSRTTSDWPRRQYGPHESLQAEASTINARARDAFRNNWQARSITAGYQRNVVGTGIWPRAQARQARPRNGGQGELLTEFNQRADKLFKRWARRPKRCDRQGIKSFQGILRQLQDERTQVGQGFVVLNFQSRRRAQTVPNLQLECFEVEQLATEFDTMRADNNGDRIVNGIRIDSGGRPIEYLVHLRDHPLETGRARQPARIPASRVLHYGQPERVGAVLSPSRLAPVLKDIFMRGGYQGNEALAKKIESFLGLAITKNPTYETGDNVGPPPLQGETTGSDGYTSDERGLRELPFEPGMGVELMPGEKVEPVESSRPGSNYQAYMDVTNREIAAGAGLSGSLVQRRATGSFSSARQEMLEDWKVFDTDQQDLIDQVVRPVWEMFVLLAMAEDFLRPPRSMAPSGGGDPMEVFGDFEALEDLVAAEFQTPARPWVDPAKEMAATKIAIDYGVTNHADVLNKLGKDWRENASDISEVMDLYSRLGIPMPWANQGGPAASPSEPKPRKSGDSGGDGNSANASAAGAATSAEQVIEWAIAEAPDLAEQAMSEAGLLQSA